MKEYCTNASLKERLTPRRIEKISGCRPVALMVASIACATTSPGPGWKSDPLLPERSQGPAPRRHCHRLQKRQAESSTVSIRGFHAVFSRSCKQSPPSVCREKPAKQRIAHIWFGWLTSTPSARSFAFRLRLGVCSAIEANLIVETPCSLLVYDPTLLRTGSKKKNSSFEWSEFV